MTRLLIIDDNPEDREWLADLAQQAGAKSAEAFPDVETALEHLKAHGADCVLLDYKLEGFRGTVYSAAFKVHAPDVPVVLVSGMDAELLDGYANELGMEFMTKPESDARTLQALFLKIERYRRA